MKKRYLAIALFVITSVLTSCGKDYTCTCVIDYNENKPTAFSDTIVINYTNVTNKMAKKQCGAESTNYNRSYDSSYMHDCAL